MHWYCYRTGNEQGMRMLNVEPPEIWVDAARYCEIEACGKLIPKPDGMTIANYKQKRFCSLKCSAENVKRERGKFSAGKTKAKT